MKRISYDLPNHTHYLTFSCYRRQQLLNCDDLRRKLIESWNEARRVGGFAVWAYVVMPEHVHMLLLPQDNDYQMSRILRLLKEEFTRRVVEYWQERSPHMLERIRCRRGQRIVHRFWQEGGGYDRNLYDWDAIQRAIDYIERNPVRRGLVSDPIDWYWSSAQSRAGRSDIPILVDEIGV